MAMLTYLVMGIVLGLSAGFAPGPLLTLVIGETLQHGLKSGLKVAFAPLMTDLPIVLLVLLILQQLADFEPLLGVIALAGSVFLIQLARQNFSVTRLQVPVSPPIAKSLCKGVLTNFLSPHPYLFWLSVGGPTVRGALNVHWLAALGFVGGFYFCLVGAKILLAVLTGRTRGLIEGRWYRLVMRLLGGLLLVMAGLLAYDGLQLLSAVG